MKFNESCRAGGKWAYEKYFQEKKKQYFFFYPIYHCLL